MGLIQNKVFKRTGIEPQQFQYKYVEYSFVMDEAKARKHYIEDCQKGFYSEEFKKH